MRKVLFASALIAATPFLMTSVAQAAPMKSLEVTVQSGGSQQSMSASFGPDGGTKSFASMSVGNFTVNNIGTKLYAPDYIDLASFDLSSGTGGTLVITLTGSGFTSPVGASNWLTQFTGNISNGTAEATAASYIDNSNTLNNAGCAAGCTLLSNVNLNSSAIATGTTTDPFALTEVITINAVGGARLSLDASVSNVPEPMSLALLGTSLIGLGLVRRSAK